MSKKKSQKEKVIAHLKKGLTLTPLQALNKFGCFRLADVIFKSKGEYDIINLHNHGQFAKYKMVL